MKKIMTIMLTTVFILSAETLFEVKDALNQKVFDVSTDGMRVFNLGDTLMVISATGVRVNLDNNPGKVLSRTFAVTTTSSKSKGLNRVLEVGIDSTKIGTGSTTMGIGATGERYTDLSPENIFIGLSSGQKTTPYLTSGINNVFLGNYSGFTNTYGGNNVFLGTSSGYSNLTGYNNCFMGYEAGYTNSTGKMNVFLGNQSGKLNSDGDYNVFIGYTAGSKNLSGDRNIFIGYESGLENTSGTANTFVGDISGTMNTIGFCNSFFGRSAGSENIDGDYNTNMGYEAANSCTSGNNNSVYGAESGRNNQTGSSNSIFGYQAARGVFGNSFSNNTIMGYQSGYSNSTGSNNTYLGFQSGYSNATGARNVFLGYMAGYNETGSDKLYIDNSNTTNPLIWGDFDSNWIKINGDFDVSNLATVGGLDVNSNAVVDGTFKLGTGATIARFSTDGTMATNSDSYVPTEKAVRTYVTASKDNLGNHTATQNIRLNGYYLSNDGGNEGVYVDAEGDVGIGTGAPGTNRLKVINNASGITGATGYFENSNSLGIGMAVYATSTDAALYVEQKHTSGGNIAKFASQYGGTWHESVVFKNSGGIIANNLLSGTGTALYLTTGNEIVKLSSSRKYKKDIAPLIVDMKKFMSLQPVSFKWNERSASENKPDNGLIAEEVEKIDPALAVYNDKGVIEGVDYQKINVMLLKVVQDQERKIEELEKRIGKLEGRNN